MKTVNLIWAEGLDDGGPVGRCRDLGTHTVGDLAAEIQRAWYLAVRQGWPGRPYVTDMDGERICLGK